MAASAIAACVLHLFYFYVRFNDGKIMKAPGELEGITGPPFSPEAVCEVAEKLSRDPISIDGVLPPKTGRRYIVVGGVGIGWICTTTRYTYPLVL